VSARKGFYKAKSSKENAKIFKEPKYNLNGATGGLNRNCLPVVRLRHQKRQFPNVESNINIQKM